jgi:type I restriction enzyme S subunit
MFLKNWAMKLNYKRLGEYIREVNVQNRDLTIKQLIGLSIQKEFIPSIANTIGTDMSTYRIIKRRQFAYCPVTSRNGEKITIALFDKYDEAILSQAYTVFEITDTNELLPEYLMMWFRRPEFDRYSRYKSHGSVRELFDWGEMCEVELPVPSIEKQQEIVAEYKTVTNRIEINNRLIQKLEETAQAIYKQWFVDFEFPDEEGKPYKSNGGEMVESEMGEVPKGWRVGTLDEIIVFRNGKTKPDMSGIYPVYGGNGIVEYVNDFNEENTIAVGRVGAYCGSLYRVFGKCWISDNAISAKSKNNSNMFAFYTLNSLNLNERSEGTGQPLITQGLLNMVKVIIPGNDITLKFERSIFALFKNMDLMIKYNKQLDNLKELLLAKMVKEIN